MSPGTFFEPKIWALFSNHNDDLNTHTLIRIFKNLDRNVFHKSASFLCLPILIGFYASHFLNYWKKAFAKNLIKIGTHRKCALYQELTRSNVGTTAMTILYYDNEMGFFRIPWSSFFSSFSSAIQLMKNIISYSWPIKKRF